MEAQTIQGSSEKKLRYKYYTDNQRGIFIIRGNRNARTDNTMGKRKKKLKYKYYIYIKPKGYIYNQR